LAAVARTHASLSRSDGKGADLRELLIQELAAHGGTEGENLLARGPVVQVPGKQAQVLSMAFHELATNAVKYGALASDNGRMEVAWDIDRNGRVRISWRETGVAIIGEPTRRGFGSDILEKSIPHMLHGSFERTFEPDGIACVIAFALDRDRGDEQPGGR